MQKCLTQASVYQLVNESIRKRAEELEKNGLKAMDALHVACAEFVGVDYFLTCDDRLLKKQKAIHVQCKNPLDFVQKIIGEQP